MKKLLLILFSLFFLSSPSVFAEEDLSKINISNLKHLAILGQLGTILGIFMG